MSELDTYIANLLTQGDLFFLQRVQYSADSLTHTSIVDRWSKSLGLSSVTVLLFAESSIRQQIVMSLVPKRCVDPSYMGSLEEPIREHLSNLSIALPDDAIRTLITICQNSRKLQHFSKQEARNQSVKLGQIKKSQPHLYAEMRGRQNSRCVWCGVPIAETGVIESLEHMVPKHIGDDLPDGKNWAISCMSCNTGKADTLAWGSSSAAHGDIGRKQIGMSTLGLAQRWVVLARDLVCIACGADAKSRSLWVYHRNTTGLLIPSHCGVVCDSCAQGDQFHIPTPDWVDRESARAINPAIATSEHYRTDSEDG